MKRSRCDFLWKAIERSIPDVRDRVMVEMSGSPHTHARYNRRYQGTYGPAIRAGKAKFPYPNTSIDGLFMCGDSVFPGIGIPAVAASGANVDDSDDDDVDDSDDDDDDDCYLHSTVSLRKYYQLS